MDNINDYKNFLINECMSSAQVSGTTADEEFIDYVIELFEENEEMFGLQKAYFEMTGKQQRKIQIDGWGYDEADQSFVLFCSKFDAFNMTPTLINTEIERLYRCMEAFVENSISGYIEENAEFSSEGRGIASDLHRLYNIGQISKFKFYIFSNITLSNMVKPTTKAKIADKDVIFNIWHLERLFTSDVNNQKREDISINVDDYVKGGLKCIKAFEEENSEYTAYLAIIPGEMLADLYDAYGSRLLEGNVRSFLSTTGKVNKGIKNTIENQPTYFFTYNNGIATTAKDVEVVNDKIMKITNLQIINGGQTTASIFFAKYHDKNNVVDLSKVYVPMKLTVVNNEEKYSTVIEKISRYSNTQNKVSDADFFSNSKFHTEFKKYSEKIYAPVANGQLHATRWFYERARGSYKQEQMKMSKAEQAKFKTSYPKEQLITKTDLAKYYNCYLCLPHVVSTGAQKNMKKFAEYYEKYLKDKINEKFYKDCIAFAILFKQTDKVLQQQSWFPKGSGYKANIVAYAISKLFDTIQTNYGGKKVLDLDRIWKEQNNLYPELKDVLMDLCKKSLEILTSDNRMVVNVTEWAKKEECWKRFKAQKYDFELNFEITLIDTTEAKAKEWSAQKEKKLDDQVNVQIQVVELGSDFWKDVVNQCVSKKIPINPIQMNDLKIAIHMSDGKRIPNSFESKRLIQFLKYAIEEGLNVDVQF